MWPTCIGEKHLFHNKIYISAHLQIYKCKEHILVFFVFWRLRYNFKKFKCVFSNTFNDFKYIVLYWNCLMKIVDWIYIPRFLKYYIGLPLKYMSAQFRSWCSVCKMHNLRNSLHCPLASDSTHCWLKYWPETALKQPQNNLCDFTSCITGN